VLTEIFSQFDRGPKITEKQLAVSSWLLALSGIKIMVRVRVPGFSQLSGSQLSLLKKPGAVSQKPAAFYGKSAIMS
jgi:hypothetical protein